MWCFGDRGEVDAAALELGSLKSDFTALEVGVGEVDVPSRREAPHSPLVSASRMLPSFSGSNDPYFGLPLWLSAACCGEVLWAYNAEHLDLLEAYVSARLRERGGILGSMSMVERLPKWIKLAKHREEVLRAVRHLRTSLV